MSLIEIMGSLLFGGIGIFMYGKSTGELRNQEILLRDNFSAQSSATELLEFFRSFQTERLKKYLQTNASGLPYLLCSHVNILDRTTGTITQPDPVANISLNILGDNSSARTTPNRFYQIQVVDSSTLTPNPAQCSKDANNLVLGPTERFYITTGVSWVPKGLPATEVKRVVLSTVIP